MPQWFIQSAEDMRRPLLSNGSVAYMEDVTVFGSDYERSQLYSETVTLSPGSYRLWHGLIANAWHPQNEWPNSGWMDLVGMVDRTYVTVEDNRMTADSYGNPARYDILLRYNISILNLVCSWCPF